MQCIHPLLSLAFLDSVLESCSASLLSLISYGSVVSSFLPSPQVITLLHIKLCIVSYKNICMVQVEYMNVMDML